MGQKNINVDCVLAQRLIIADKFDEFLFVAVDLPAAFGDDAGVDKKRLFK